MSIDLTIGAIGDVSLKHARQQKNDSIKNLASGKKQDMAWKDSGSYSLGLRLENQKRYESGLSASLQNAMSIAQSQEDALNRMSKLLSKMNELAGQASSVGVLSADRENYQAAFAGFVDDFEKIQNETFNNKSIFGNTMGDEEKQLLESLKTHWLAATEKLVQEEYGWTADSSDSWDLVIEENGAVGGSAAYVASSWSVPSYISQVTKLSIDLPDLAAPHTVGNSTTDTLIAHEMVHLLQAQNTYMGDQAGGDPSRDMTWLAEGLAEFIRGADYRANSSINSLGVAALLQKPDAGWGGGSDDYAGAYLAVKYLDNQIRSSGASAVNGVNASEGIKHLTTWMKEQKDANAGASASGLNQYIENHLNATHGYGVGDITDTSGQAIDDFITDLESVTGGQAYVNGLVSGGNLTDTDTGSVHGSEYGGAVKDSAAVVDDDASYISGFPSQLTYEEEEVEDPEPIELGGGVDLNLSAISPVSFGDTSTYNLETESGAKLVMERVDELIEIITNSLSQVGSNMGAIERSANIVSMRQSTIGNAISRVNEVSLPEESMNLAKSDILINSNLMMRAQAKAIQQDVMLTLIS
jgi:flagellin